MRKPIAVLVVVLLALAGCRRASEPAPGPAPAVPAQSTHGPTDAMQALLPCADAGFFDAAGDARLAMLQRAGLQCAPADHDAQAIHCSGEGVGPLFGLAWRDVDIWPGEDEPGLSLRFDHAPEAVRAAVERVRGRPLREDPELAGNWDMQSATEPVTLSVTPAEDGPGTVVSCRRAAGHASGVPAGWARLSGIVTYPSEGIPPMRVCAVARDDAGTGYCIDLDGSSPDWQLAVPRGTWLLWAWPEAAENDGRPGRHSQASSCIAEVGEGCDAHAMRAVEVVADEARSGLMINDWYADDGADPPYPPRGETVPAG